MSHAGELTSVHTSLRAKLTQKSLKPVLANLACYYMLDLMVLRALAHLLEHLCSWFNVTLGELPPSLCCERSRYRHAHRSRGSHSLCRCLVSAQVPLSFTHVGK